MKNFVKMVFAVIMGNAIFFGFFFLIIILSVIGGLAMRSKKATISTGDQSLILNLDKPIIEEQIDQNSIFINQDEPLNMHSIIQAIDEAKNDPNIQSILIQMNYNSDISYPQVDMIRNAIKEFKKSKKPVYAYGEVASQKMYYLGTVADKVYINPNGMMDVRGFGAQVMFIKGLLDKLEIEPQIFYAGKFKSATEPLRMDHMSEENKVQTRELLSDVSKIVIQNISQDRKIPVEEVESAINDLKTFIAADAIQSKLIDGQKYQDEVEDELKKAIGINDKKEISWIKLNDYIDDHVEWSTTGKIAVYVAEGDIIDGKSTTGSIGSQTLVKDIHAIAKDPDVKGLVLRINSPGGSALASAVMLRELALLRKSKPVVVSMGDVAASGGYYISCEADKVFAEPNTITGSIGVFGIIPNVGRMLKDKLGVTFDEVELNNHAVMGVDKSLDAFEKTKITNEIENTYHTFKSVVSKGRNLSMDSVEAIAQGRVWSGVKAKSLGLVNEIGSLENAIIYLADSLNCKSSDYFFYNHRKSDLEILMEDLESSKIWEKIKISFLKSTLGNYFQYFDELYKYGQMRGVQARMPYELSLW